MTAFECFLALGIDTFHDIVQRSEVTIHYRERGFTIFQKYYVIDTKGAK